MSGDIEPDDDATEIVLLGRTFTPATNDGRQGWEFRYVDQQPYPVWFGTESTDLSQRRHLAAALDEIKRLRADRTVAHAEIVRLRNSVDALTNLFDDQCDIGRRYARAVNKAEAEVERLRAAGRALVRHVDESGYGTDLERSLIAAWQEACRER